MNNLGSFFVTNLSLYVSTLYHKSFLDGICFILRLYGSGEFVPLNIVLYHISYLRNYNGEGP